MAWLSTALQLALSWVMGLITSNKNTSAQAQVATAETLGATTNALANEQAQTAKGDGVAAAGEHAAAVLMRDPSSLRSDDGFERPAGS